MPALNKNTEIHLELLVEFVKEHQPISLVQIVSKIGKDKELVKKLDLTHYHNKSGSFVLDGKKRINRLIKQLVKDERIETKEDEDRGTLYQAVKKQINLQEVTIVPQEQKKGKKKNEEKWIVWTNPVFIPENNRWEFYQKNEKDLIQEIYHSEDEVEIRSMHQRKISEHIISSMQNEEKNNPLDEPIQKIEEKPKRVDKMHISSTDIKENIIYDIFELKVKGESYWEIAKTISKNYGIMMSSVATYYTETLTFIREKSKGIVDETIQEHSERYEALYKWFNENGYSRLAVKVMERREKLLGVENDEKTNLLLINTLGDRGLDAKKYNFEQLSKNEKITLITLIRKTINKK